jgi:hypothetical protein
MDPRKKADEANQYVKNCQHASGHLRWILGRKPMRQTRVSMFTCS